MFLNRLISGLIVLVLVSEAFFYGDEKDSPPDKKAARVSKSTAWSALNKSGGRSLWWVYRDGREEAVQAPFATYYFPRISPDGTQIAFMAVVGGDRDIWLLDITQDAIQRLTFTEGSDNHPVWSPDGKRIAFTSQRSLKILSQRGSTGGLVSIPADGSGDTELLGLSPGKFLFAFSWSKDGKTLVTSEVDTNFKNFDIGMITTEWDRPYTLLLKESYKELQPQLSPDGRWLAYCTDEESGELQVYVSPFPDVNSEKWNVSAGSGTSPRWSADGKELYFLIGQTTAEAVMAVDIETEPAFKPGKPRILFTGAYIGPLPDNGIPYDVHPDGERFLMMKE